MGVLDGCLFQFPQLLGEGQGQEAVNNGVDQNGVRHIIFSHQLLR